MATLRSGRVIYKHDLSPTLTIFRLAPQSGTVFPSYVAGQYIALGRDDARLTRKVGEDANGRPVFAPDLDEHGRQRIGSVIHSYTVASAPWETTEHGYLEFYVVLEMTDGRPGRLSTVLLGMTCGEHESIKYVDRIIGSFTLEKLVKDAKRVVLVGTGTGLAPFISMVKQLHHDASASRLADRIYTLLHTNRTTSELGYDDTLREVEAAGSFDFAYVPTVSRPTPQDLNNPALGIGRATNVLRLLYELPMKEEEAARAPAGSEARAIAESKLARTPPPRLPSTADIRVLRRRVTGSDAVIIACGNPASTADIQWTARRVGIRSEVEP